jgi:hypothetical protein
VAEQQARDPRAAAAAAAGTNESYCKLTSAMDWDGQHTAGDHIPNVMFRLGEVWKRTAVAPTSVTGTADGVSAQHSLSLDAALFPFLHPGNKGAYVSGESLSSMLRQRMQQLFSPFTLVKEYLLVMFQVRQPPLRSGHCSCFILCTGICMPCLDIHVICIGRFWWCF